MAIFLTVTNGKPAFYDDDLGDVPADGLKISDTLHQQLLQANSCGASLAIQNGQAVVLDWQGQVIDLSKMTAESSYSKPPTLADLASAAFQKARQQFQDLQMMGETFGPKMQAYMQALNAIIKGTDTTSTALPTTPSDPTQ